MTKDQVLKKSEEYKARPVEIFLDNANYLNPCCLLLAYLKPTRILLRSLSVYAVSKMFVDKYFSYLVYCVYI